MRSSCVDSSSWFSWPSRNADIVDLYVAQSASLMALLTATYSGSRSIRGAVIFFSAFCCDGGAGSVLFDNVGVVTMLISFGRMVAAMMAGMNGDRSGATRASESGSEERARGHRL